MDAHTLTGAEIPIELRGEEEVLTVAGRRLAPAASHALNPAFDITPATLVTAIVTETRVLRISAEHPLAPARTDPSALHPSRSSS